LGLELIDEVVIWVLHIEKYEDNHEGSNEKGIEGIEELLVLGEGVVHG
jgi:Fe-S-cluster formation regulator IscX/YfhJ